MTEKEIDRVLANFASAVERLNEVLSASADDAVSRDSAILRFALAYELAWKTLKRCLYKEGINTGTPREALKHAFRAGWLENEK